MRNAVSLSNKSTAKFDPKNYALFKIGIERNAGQQLECVPDPYLMNKSRGA